MNKLLMHIDMDAFFASVETRDNPLLKGKPIAVVGASQRTVLVSPSYQAREFGVKTGMTKYEAKRLCPLITFVTASNHKYTFICSEIMKILYRFTPYIEVYSIDEFFIDVTQSCHLFGTPEQLANKIKDDIKREQGITCTIGISYNKLLAKIGSDHNKPDGVFEINEKNKDQTIDPLEVGSIWGIGSRTSKKLNLIGVKTIADLKKISEKYLKAKFGIYGALLYDMARGIYDSDIITPEEEQEAKSIGHSMTFKENTKDMKVLKNYLFELSMRVSERLRRDEFTGRCITLTVRYESFKTFQRQKSIMGYVNSTAKIHRIAMDILKSIKLDESVRLLGVSVSGLKHEDYKIFLFKEEEKKDKLDFIVDKVCSRFGTGSMTYASLVNKKAHKKVISPAWRPAGTRNY